MSHNRTVVQPNGAKPMLAPDPEVRAAPRRQTFSAEYKLSILTEAERCCEPGAIGALLRREGLYSSHLTEWRRQRASGGQRDGDALTASKERQISRWLHNPKLKPAEIYRDFLT